MQLSRRGLENLGRVNIPSMAGPAADPIALKGQVLVIIIHGVKKPGSSHSFGEGGQRVDIWSEISFVDGSNPLLIITQERFET